MSKLTELDNVELQGKKGISDPTTYVRCVMRGSQLLAPEHPGTCELIVLPDNPSTFLIRIRVVCTFSYDLRNRVYWSRKKNHL